PWYRQRGRDGRSRRPCVEETEAARERPATPVPTGRREPLVADRGRHRLSCAVRIHLADGADDERPGALGASLAQTVSLAELRRRVPPGADLALGPEHDDLRRARHARRARLEHSGCLRALADPLAWTQLRVRACPDP